MEQKDYLELSEDGKTVISCQKDYQGAVVIPDSVTEIGDEAFWGCENLTSIEIPKGVEVIRENTFAACTSLTSVEIPDSVTEIGESAFYHCSSLIEVHLQHKTPIDLSNAFRGNHKTNVTIHVPKGAREAYRNCEHYKDFKEIIEE